MLKKREAKINSHLILNAIQIHKTLINCRLDPCLFSLKINYNGLNKK